MNMVIPAVKNTAEFVTIPDVTWKDVGGLEKTKTRLYNQFMVSRLSYSSDMKESYSIWIRLILLVVFSFWLVE